MNIYLPQNWAPIIKRQTQHRRVHGFAHLTPDEAKALVDYDTRLNGYEALHSDSWVGQATFNTAYDLDHPDLARAICIGIERNTAFALDDPLYAERDMLRTLYTAVFGDLDQPLHIQVGRFGGAEYVPNAIMDKWLKRAK